ncbi:zinc finger BED domain-containing protein 1-like isoform X2 [Thalassophryne amazonica]|uniref:zinc finger BED domain-containing protein 1-like isoform X2 n=1 Tax=Thalassophryne amazonica TaxID=390379 RepID=UPI001471467E|nr:zinc finger BED domain-containing protein 1-like isoform X2 [Thalassophryne amazonica]
MPCLFSYCDNKIICEMSLTYDEKKDTLYAASALDPRFKAVPSLSAQERDDAFSRLQTEAVTAALDQNAEGNDAGGEGAEEIGRATSPKKLKKSSTLESLLGAVYSLTVQEHEEKTPATRAEDEVRRYRMEKPAGLNDNPLNWWRSNEKEYPLLACLAKRYLCVPGTSIASERVFSTAGDITAKRSCLTPDHVNELLFLHKNLTTK